MNSCVKPADLVELLCGETLRIRTGILLLPLNLLGDEPELAARLGIEAVDWRGWKLKRLESNSRFLGLSGETVLKDLQEIVDDIDLAGNCLWIYNADLFLSALCYDERRYLWDFLFSTFKQHRGLLLSLPAQALGLLPMQKRRAWEDDNRLAKWEGV